MLTNEETKHLINPFYVEAFNMKLNYFPQFPFFAVGNNYKVGVPIVIFIRFIKFNSLKFKIVACAAK